MKELHWETVPTKWLKAYFCSAREITQRMRSADTNSPACGFFSYVVRGQTLSSKKSPLLIFNNVKKANFHEKKNQGILTFSLQGESYLMGKKKKTTKNFLIKAKNVIKILDIQYEQELIKSLFSKYFPLGPTKEPGITPCSALGRCN